MPILPNITPSPANAFGSTTPIHQPTITPGPAQISSIPLMRQETITFYLVNILSLTPPICQPTITPGPTQIGLIPSQDWPQQVFNSYTNPYTQIPPIKMPNKILPTTIIAQFVKI